MRKIILNLMLLFICLLSAINTNAQTIRYVKPIATGTGDGSSWTNATGDLQAMIFISGAGDEVWVASGTYYPTQYPIFNSNDPSTNSSYPMDERDKTFSIKDNMKLYGGFVGTETLLSQRPAYTNDASASILSGDIDKDGALNWGNCWHVVFLQYTSSATIFDGFTVTGGHAIGTRRMAVQGYYIYQNSGGGMNSTRNGNATLNNIIFKGNQATNGGGINNFSTSSPTITNCKFIENLAVTGGGINSLQNCNPSVSNCIFSNNYCTSSGGGLNYYMSNPIVTNSVFTGNRANDAGGAIYGTNGTLNLFNCTFSANETPNNGGAIHSSSNTNISNCIIWGNLSNGVLNSNAGGYYNSNPSSTSSVNYSIVQGSSVYAGTGNSNADPLFVNSALPAGSDGVFGTSDDGLAVQFTSLAVDFSDPTTSSPATDVTGFTRVGVFDSGAYENRCNPPAPTVSATPLFCGAVLENMAVGTNIKWYDALTGGNLLNATALLVNGTTYYATQTPSIGSCESHPRTAMTANFILTSCIYTAIPDANFEQELITQGYDTVIDGKVLTANISAITTLNVSNKNIASLTGIQDFVSLTSLNCSFNQLTSLNIAGLIHLSVLDCSSNALTSLNTSTLVNLAFFVCSYNQLTSLNLSGLNALQAVSCDYNQITSLNGSGLLSLGYITCDHNQLTSINISGLSNFINLIADHNQLTSVDLSGGTNPHLLYLHNNLLTGLNLSGKTNLTVLNCLNNPNITCIRVDNVTTATNNLSWQKDATASYSSASCTSSPIAASPQHFCSAVTIADLSASGTNLKWYADAVSTTVLASSTPLSSANYYVSQTINDDESPRTVVAVGAYLTPISGNSLNFDGIDDYVEVGNIMPTTYTKEAWINASAFSTSNNVISGGDFDGQHAFYIPSGHLSSGHNGLWNSVQDPASLALNTWYHIAVTYDEATTTMNLYKNGVLVSTNTGIAAFNVGNALRIGAYNTGANIFQGSIDEVRVWSRVLSQIEIQNNMNNELVSGQTGLVAYYKFNQGINNANNTTINTLTDSSGNTNTGTLNGIALTGSTSNWVATSPIATTTAPQIFCNAGTVADLTTAAAGTINWYDVATAGSPLVGTTALTTGTYYYTQTISGCESARTAVLVTVTLSPPPTASAQVFCDGGTVANLTASGTGTINWYDVATGGSPLVGTTALITRTYYVSQTVGTCESLRTAVSVTIGVPTPTGLNTQVYAGTTTLADLTVTGTAIQWYAAPTGGTALITTTNLIDGTTYYASQTINSCESINRIAVTAKKISEPNQTVCNPSTVADLLSTPSAGATINWYSTPSGGVALTSGTALNSGIYYAEQTSTESTIALGSGFSSPTGVSVQADGKIVVADYGNNSVKRMNADGTAIVTLGSGFLNPIGVAVQADGTILVTDTGNGAVKRMNADGTNIVTLGSGFVAPSGIAVQADERILVSDTGNGTLKRMNADGTGIITLGSGFTVPHGVAVQADGKILLTNFSSHTVKQMNADGTGLVTIGSGFNLPYGVAVQSDGKILVVNTGDNTLKRMNADGTGIITIGSGLWSPYGVAVQSDGTIFVADGNNNAIKKINVANVSNRVAVNVTVGFPAPTGLTTQVYSGTATLANLTATGTAIQWYATAIGGTPLVNTTTLTDGTTYYASQTLNSCETLNRLAVTAKKISESTQTVCDASSVANLVSTPSAGATINWYSAASGGAALTSGTALSTSTYYAEQTIPENTIALGSGFYYPRGITVQTDGKIIVADTFNHAVKRMNADGTGIVTLGTGFTHPSGVAVQADGKILVADTDNNAIKRMDADGSNIVTLGTGFLNPYGIAIQANGKIVVADTSNNTIKRMDADGTNVVTLGSGFNTPFRIAVQSDGKIVVADSGNNVIKRMDADGTNIVTLASGFSIPIGVAVQTDGKIVVADYGNNAIKRMNADGTGIVTLGSGLANPYEGIIQSDGTILVADFANNAIKKISEASVGNRLAVNVILSAAIPVPTANAQTFCNGATVANLVATGTALQWYNVASGGSTLLSTDVLATGTYYVSQTASGCESARTSVLVTLGNTTTWNGSIWDNGVPTSTSKAIISGNFTATSDLSACSLDITGTAVVNVPTGINFNVSGAVTVANTASLTFENNANLIQQGTTNTNTGNVVVKRNSSALKRLDYTLWSSPVANQKLLDFSPATLATRFYTYNTTTNKYNVVASPSTTNFATADGYLIRMPDTHPATPTVWNGIFTGVPNNGDIPYTMTDGGAGFRFNLVGNPYPSPINMAQFVTDNTTITGTLYFWRKTNNPLSPSYCTWNAGIFTTNGEAQVVNPAGIIQTGQGFIVEANGTGTNLVFNNNQRVANNTGQFFKIKQTVENNRIWLNATNALGAFSQMAVGYITEATQGVDSFDGKYYNDGAIALNSILNNTDYVIQGRALPFDATDVVPMSFSAKTAGDYTIAIDHVDGIFSGNQAVILVDNATGIETDLKTTSYTFSTSAGMDTTRFSLKYQKTLGINTPSFDENNVTIFKNKGLISIKSSLESIANVKVFDINGRLLFEKSKVNANETNIDSSKFANQVLIVRITSEEGKVINKKVVN